MVKKLNWGAFVDGVGADAVSVFNVDVACDIWVTMGVVVCGVVNSVVGEVGASIYASDKPIPKLFASKLGLRWKRESQSLEIKLTSTLMTSSQLVGFACSNGQKIVKLDGCVWRKFGEVDGWSVEEVKDVELWAVALQWVGDVELDTAAFYISWMWSWYTPKLGCYDSENSLIWFTKLEVLVVWSLELGRNLFTSSRVIAGIQRVIVVYRISQLGHE